MIRIRSSVYNLQPHTQPQTRACNPGLSHTLDGCWVCRGIGRVRSPVCWLVDLSMGQSMCPVTKVGWSVGSMVCMPKQISHSLLLVTTSAESTIQRTSPLHARSFQPYHIISYHIKPIYHISWCLLHGLALDTNPKVPSMHSFIHCSYKDASI